MTTQPYHQVERLLGKSNYRSWKLSVIAFLECGRCDEFLSASIPPPADVADREVWRDKKAIAMSTLVASIHSSLFDRIEGTGWDIADRDPFNLWNAVTQVVQAPSCPVE
ncbi:hypothetical protein HYQ46_000375 [Verticillium longisporum]|nr:hypothetical protein HYQ46_000375 [Verticillium longisporum]